MCACKTGQDVVALSLLVDGLVSFHSLFTSGERVGDDILVLRWHVLFAACFFEREFVVRGLLHIGADLDALHANGQTSYTPAGYAIKCGNLSMLEFCHRHGASMDIVSKWQPTSPPGESLTSVPRSAVDLTMTWDQPAMLEFLLDEVYPVRPAKLSCETILSHNSAIWPGSEFRQVNMRLLVCVFCPSSRFSSLSLGSRRRFQYS